MACLWWFESACLAICASALSLTLVNPDIQRLWSTAAVELTDRMHLLPVWRPRLRLPKWRPWTPAKVKADAIKVVSWNAASFDKKYSKSVQPQKFFRVHKPDTCDFVLLQEAAGRKAKGGTLEEAKRVGFQYVHTDMLDLKSGIAICWNGKKFTRLDGRANFGHRKLHLDSHESGAAKALFCKFREEATGTTIVVMSVHAGHNRSERSQEQAGKDLGSIQKEMLAGGTDLLITGGDLNEMHRVVDSSWFGKGCRNDKTHRTNKYICCKIGVKGSFLAVEGTHPVSSGAWDEFKGPFYGSDHKAIELTISRSPARMKTG